MTDNPSKEQLHSALFFNLVLTFQAATMQAFGKVENPAIGKVEKNLEQAKMSIDMLDMLEIKTKNNLTTDESHFLSKVVDDLKMAYIQESK